MQLNFQFFHSIIPLDSNEASTHSQSALQRSFNLMRLRAIEVQRNLAATTFYQEELNLNDQSMPENGNGSR